MGAPKALLRFKDRTFIEHILGAIHRSQISDVVIVVGRHRQEIEEANPRGRLVFNADYELGMITSIKAGIRALPDDVQGALLFLVDHPLVQPETIDMLVDSFRPGSIIVPVFKGRRGHPVLFSTDTFPEILAVPVDQGANVVLRRDPGRVIEAVVDDAGVLRDVDTPEDFDDLLRGNSLS